MIFVNLTTLFYYYTYVVINKFADDVYTRWLLVFVLVKYIPLKGYRMKKLMAIVVVSSIVTFCVGCTPDQNSTDVITEDVIANNKASKAVPLVGSWIIDLDAGVMIDPQTSGLKYDNGFLYSLSDASAHASQVKRLHKISPDDSQIMDKFGPTEFSDSVRNSCFYDYLAGKPDYEGLAPIPGEEDAWVFVTEDASRSKQLSETCQQQFANTGSTFFPTLLVRLKLSDDSIEVTHVRPIQFPISAQVGDSPNDGIEGLTFTKDNRLLLGLEKDANKQPRVFEVAIDDKFWQASDFAVVSDSELLLPTFEQGNHPINGMDVYYPSPDSAGYLLAAARNDSELWVVDLAKSKPTKRIKLAFFAPSGDAACESTHLMDNASIEGVAVVGNDVWMVNDPWKVNYLKNVVCASDEYRYQQMSPLLFRMKIEDAWFE